MCVATAPSRITGVESAVAYLEEHCPSVLSTLEGENLIFSAACGRCGGRGYGHWHQDSGICYECRGANTTNHKTKVSVVAYARKMKGKARAAAKKQEQYAAKKAESLANQLAGQKKWCEEHGHGPITFAELKIKQEAEKAATQAKQSYVGTIGKREEFTLFIDKMLTFDSMFGMKVLHLFHDAAGNQLVWWTGDFLVEKAEGQEIKVKATVKDHAVYNGAKQTTLSRVKEL